MNTLNLNGFEKAQLPPVEGEIREWKDGKYQFNGGRWSKIIEESNLTLKELPDIFKKLDNLAKTGETDSSIKYFAELRKKYPDIDKKIDTYQRLNKLGKYYAELDLSPFREEMKQHLENSIKRNPK